ncbi:hypothetical protein [Falsirhodobacter deserti]|uniref:hypothetical protein n=1 Tax=Falsirhodobacter deserti TaxID=1365611 RepID=UPI000FE302BE|nr:hypothetical protein [Falsirhodobacter deserti]
MRTLTPILSFCALTACAASPADRPAPPPSLLVPCAAPQGLPDRSLTQAEVELAWGRDRTALRDCRDRLAALALWQDMQPEPDGNQ